MNSVTKKLVINGKSNECYASIYCMVSDEAVAVQSLFADIKSFLICWFLRELFSQENSYLSMLQLSASPYYSECQNVFPYLLTHHNL